jgi:uroporphyrinogen decarboxylase
MIFFTRCQTPELAAEITVQPRRIPDADFIFGYIGNSTSHGIEVEMKPNFGPYLPNPIRTIQDGESNRSRCS